MTRKESVRTMDNFVCDNCWKYVGFELESKSNILSKCVICGENSLGHYECNQITMLSFLEEINFKKLRNSVDIGKML